MPTVKLNPNDFHDRGSHPSKTAKGVAASGRGCPSAESTPLQVYPARFAPGCCSSQSTTDCRGQ